MQPSRNRESWMLVTALGVALALVACTQKASMDSAGNGGAQSLAPGPTAGTTTGTGGVAAPAASGSGGAIGSTAGAPPAGTGGQVATNASGGAAPPAVDSGTPSMSGSNDAGPEMPNGDGGMVMAAQEDLGKGDGSDVVTIGDSWMSIITNGGGIEGGLDRAGTSYRHYSVAGTLLLNGQIPGQYDQAKAINPNILTVIMTGGGNDIMFSNGCATKEACTMAVQQIADGLDMLWSTMADDGVKDVIYIAYSKNAGTAPSDTRPDMAPIPKICTTGRIRCHSVDTTDLVGPTDTVDGIHPTLPACDAIAKRVMDLMESGGMRR